MDENLRILERHALLGDERARHALERERIRLGRGWFDEALPAGLRTAVAKPLYLWTPPKGYAIELVFVPAAELWISRRPVSKLLYRTFSQVGGGDRRGPALVAFADAVDYASWASVALVWSAEWRDAFDAKCLEALGGPEWVRTSSGGAGITPPTPRWGPRWPETAAFRIAVRPDAPP